MELTADRTRALSTTDPDGRLLLLSCGTALHHARIALAAAGWQRTVDALPDPAAGPAGPDHLTGNEPADPGDPAAGRGDRRRRTDRRAFGDRPVTDAELTRLRRRSRPRARTCTWCGPTRSPMLADLRRAGGSAEPATRPTAPSCTSWTSRPAGSGDGVPPATAVRPALRRVPVRDFAPEGDAGLSAGRGHDQGAAYVVVFGPGDQPADLLRGGEALSALLLLATADGLATAPLSDAVEVEWPRHLLRGLLAGVGEPYLVVRLGYRSRRAAARRRRAATRRRHRDRVRLSTGDPVLGDADLRLAAGRGDPRAVAAQQPAVAVPAARRRHRGAGRPRPAARRRRPRRLGGPARLRRGHLQRPARAGRRRRRPAEVLLRPYRATGSDRPADPRAAPRPPTYAEPDLYAAIPRRYSNRRPFWPDPVPAETRVRLIEAARAEGGWLDLLVGMTALTGFAEIAQQRRPGAAPRPALPGRAVALDARRRGPGRRPGRAPARRSPSRRTCCRSARSRTGRAHPAATSSRSRWSAVLGAAGDRPVDQIIAGQALQRVLLTATDAGLASSMISQPIEVPAAREQLRRSLGRSGHAADGPTDRLRPAGRPDHRAARPIDVIVR